MSRIGNEPITVPEGVTVTVVGNSVSVTGPRGELSQQLPPVIAVRQEGNQVLVERPTDSAPHRSLHGLSRTLVANMVTGVTAGYRKELELQGVGYRASLQGADLQLSLGYSHPIRLTPPEGIKIEVPEPTRVAVLGNDKQLVGQTAARIRATRKPEPYKGKGVRYRGEVVRRKAGKSGKGAKV
ncbi:MAG: 50S ribosomal protein L6 [Candidatus Dormiibacterota bacterium]